MTEKIVVLDALAEPAVARMRTLLPPGMELSAATARDEAAQQAAIADADYAISGQIAVPGSVLRAAKKLKLLHKWGVGVDNFDLDAARALGIKVARTTGSNSVAVAEFAVGLMFALMRNLAYGHSELQKGVWHGTRMPNDALLLSSKTFGIIGLGAIGKNVARFVSVFAGRILYHKPNRLDPAEEQALGVTYASVPELLREADIVSLHCPMTPQTAGMINRAALETMKKTAVIINVARGGVVVEDDLVWALKNKVIRGAAMDVYDIEPQPADNKFVGLDNVVTTPHIAAIAADTYVKTVQQMFTNILHVSRGEPIPPKDLVVG